MVCIEASSPGISSQGCESQPAIDGISALLSQYQKLLSQIMAEPQIPGITLEELEAFRYEHRTSAFTCRLRSCPGATMGFGSAKLRMEHERSHVSRSLNPCTFPACQYPPFFTPEALKAHTRQQHDAHMATPRKAIRRVAAIVSRDALGRQPEVNSTTRNESHDASGTLLLRPYQSRNNEVSSSRDHGADLADPLLPGLIKTLTHHIPPGITGYILPETQAQGHEDENRPFYPSHLRVESQNGLAVDATTDTPPHLDVGAHDQLPLEHTDARDPNVIPLEIPPEGFKIYSYNTMQWEIDYYTIMRGYYMYMVGQARRDAGSSGRLGRRRVRFICGRGHGTFCPVEFECIETFPEMDMCSWHVHHIRSIDASSHNHPPSYRT